MVAYPGSCGLCDFPLNWITIFLSVLKSELLGHVRNASPASLKTINGEPHNSYRGRALNLQERQYISTKIYVFGEKS